MERDLRGRLRGSAFEGPRGGHRRVRTPTLVTAGRNDRCTPPGQAVEFHRALRARGIETDLVLYPEEGHGVRRFPAVIDLCTRMVAWFEDHMPPAAGRVST